MIKNGRPLTIEGGISDSKLFDELNLEGQEKIINWVKTNLQKCRKVNMSRSSYGIKQILTRETGVYITDNQFKDVLLMLGYRPHDVNESTWHFNMVLTRDLNNNPSEFFRFAKKYRREDSPKGDFVRDMLGDFDFPTESTKEAIMLHLSWAKAEREAVKAFNEIWNEYERSMNND